MTVPVKSEGQYVQVGASGLFVYRVGLGTMQFGWSVDEAGAVKVLDAYAEAGGNFIDTADCYSSWSASMGGPPNAGGVAEEIVGRWLAARGNRDDMVVATKVRAAMGESFSQGRSTVHQREGLSRRWIMKACEDSLRRLGVDYIDLYQTHFLDPRVPIEETLSALSDLVRQGKVRYLGCSNYSAWRLVEALWTSDRRQPARPHPGSSRDGARAGMSSLRHRHVPLQSVGWRVVDRKVPSRPGTSRKRTSGRECRATLQ
jgi:aryl-alcohol dehydrogenase-like predicted oxidoreductase